MNNYLIVASNYRTGSLDNQPGCRRYHHTIWSWGHGAVIHLFTVITVLFSMNALISSRKAGAGSRGAAIVVMGAVESHASMST